MANPGYEVVEHTADWALKVRGENLDQLLVTAARGMFELTGVSAAGPPGDDRTFALEARDREGLLVAWLEELLFELETRSVAFSQIEVRTEAGRSLRATAIEFPVTPPIRAIKAVTFHNLEIVDDPQGVQATIVFDV